MKPIPKEHLIKYMEIILSVSDEDFIMVHRHILEETLQSMKAETEYVDPFCGMTRMQCNVGKIEEEEKE